MIGTYFLPQNITSDKKKTQIIAKPNANTLSIARSIQNVRQILKKNTIEGKLND